MQLAQRLLNAVTSQGNICSTEQAWVRQCVQEKTSRQQLFNELTLLPTSDICQESLNSEAVSYLTRFLSVENRLMSRWLRTYPVKSPIYSQLRRLSDGKVVSLLNKWMWGGDQKLFLILLSQLRKSRFSTRYMRLEDVFAKLNFDSLTLMGTLISPIDVSTEHAGCYEHHNIVSSYLLGIDIIHSTQGDYILESNVSPGVNENRKAVYEQDPIVDAILDMAKSIEAETVVLNWAWLTPVNPWFKEQLFRKSKLHGIRIRVSLDPRLAKSQQYPEASSQAAEKLAQGKTLIIRTRDNLGGQDLLLGNKQMLNALLLRYQRTGEATRYSVAEMRSMPHVDWIVPQEQGFPNLVYKYVYENKGEGVHFINATSIDDALAEAQKIDRATGLKRGMFQRYTPCDLLEGRRFYDIRSFALVSPRAVRFAGCLRRVSATPIPKNIEQGWVKNAKPYLSNVSAGNKFSACPPEETALVEKTTISVGSAIQASMYSAFTVTGLKL